MHNNIKGKCNGKVTSSCIIILREKRKELRIKRRKNLMKNLKHFMTALLILSLVACLTSCMKVDLGVEIRENNTATTTTKVYIERDVYEMMTEMGENDSSLEGFTPDAEDENYYSKTETKEHKSLEELADSLLAMEVRGIPLFSSVRIENVNSKTYFFEVKTSDENSSNEAIPEGALAFRMTVKLPGEVIVEDVVGGEVLEDGSVRFATDDFSKSNTFTVSSETKDSHLVRNIIIWVVGLTVIVVVNVIHFRNVKKSKKVADAEMEKMLGNKTNKENVDDTPNNAEE